MVLSANTRLGLKSRQCNRWEQERSSLKSTLEPPLTPEAIIGKLIGSNENWLTGSKIIAKLMTDKENENRRTKQDRT